MGFIHFYHFVQILQWILGIILVSSKCEKKEPKPKFHGSPASDTHYFRHYWRIPGDWSIIGEELFNPGRQEVIILNRELSFSPGDMYGWRKPAAIRDNQERNRARNKQQI